MTSIHVSDDSGSRTAKVSFRRSTQPNISEFQNLIKNVQSKEIIFDFENLLEEFYSEVQNILMCLNKNVQIIRFWSISYSLNIELSHLSNLEKLHCSSFQSSLLTIKNLSKKFSKIYLENIILSENSITELTKKFRWKDINLTDVKSFDERNIVFNNVPNTGRTLRSNQPITEQCLTLKDIDFSKTKMIFQDFELTELSVHLCKNFKWNLVDCANLANIQFIEMDIDFGSTPVFPKLTDLVLEECVVLNDVLPIIPNIRYVRIVDTNLNPDNVDQWMDAARRNHIDFDYVREHAEVEGSEIENSEMENSDENSENEDIDIDDNSPEINLNVLPTLLANDDIQNQLLWISEICHNKEDPILKDQFDAKEQVIAIVSTNNQTNNQNSNQNSIVHCFALSSLLEYWFPVLQGFDDKTDSQFGDHNDNQVYKWVGPSNSGRPIKTEPVFKIPMLEVWINYDGYKMITKYSSHVLIKVDDDQKVGSVFGVGRIHGESVKLYTLMPINKKFLQKSIVNQTFSQISITDEDLNKYTSDSVEPSRKSKEYEKFIRSIT